MESYQILLSVGPEALKSQYPFVIMDELLIKKTREYIDLEFTNKLTPLRRKKYNRPRNIRGGKDDKTTILFVEF